MAKEAGATHKATPKKKENARKEGNVGQSKDLALLFSLFVFLVLIFLGEWFVKGLYTIVMASFNLIETGVTPRDFMLKVGWEAIKIVGPVLCAIVVAVFVNYFIQVKFLFSLKIIKPQIKRLNPMNYFKRLFSKKTVFDVVKSFLVVVLLGYIVYLSFSKEIEGMITAINLPWKTSLIYMYGIFKSTVIKIIIAFGIVAIADYFWQKYTYEDDLKMKLEDVRREYKEQNGSPEVKGRQRQVMIAMLRNEIRKKVPEATFVVTNPTHYAVAIRYIPKEDQAPVILAKGIDHIALFIKEIAIDNEISIIENPELARDIYTRCVENEYIPQDLYLVVSGILKKLVLQGKIKI